MKNKTIHIPITEELLKAIAAQAKREYRSKTHLITLAIERYLDDAAVLKKYQKT